MDLKKINLTIDKLKKLQKLSNDARSAILQMTTLAKSGHPGGSMSSIDFLLTLYHLLEFDNKNPKWENRDRVVISCGHISPAVYSTLGLMGFFDLEKAISQFRLAGSIFEGHVEPDVPGVEWASGNLGQGLSAACGFALASQKRKLSNHTFCIMGDGEQQKGQLSEARRFAVKYNLKITGIIDYNQLQISGDINEVMPQNIVENYASDGWKVIEINGHDLVQIRDAIIDSVNSTVPTMILAHTTMGKGVSFMENKEKYHGSTLSKDQLEIALNELGTENKLKIYKKLRKEFVKGEDLNTNSTSKFEINIEGNLIYNKTTDCRSAWGNALADIAKKNMHAPLFVFDCDLQGSVKTNEFEDVLKDNFIQSGIMEHNTAVMAAAMSLEDIQVFWADFGVFGVDETFNQHRLSDINNTNLKVITTHVGLDVGEDGKTHQCIDYYGVMKNLYHFKTIIPADPNQTDRIVRYVASRKGNYLIPMGRSKLEILRDKKDNIIFGESYKFEYGKADILCEGNDASLFVMGTLANNAVEISNILNEKGIKLRVYNISCPDALDKEALRNAAKTGFVFTYEDHNVNTGLGNSIADKMMQLGLPCKFQKFGVEDYALSGKSSDVFKECGLDIESVVKKIEKELK